MALTRYVLYFLGIALITWLLTQLEILSPGGLMLQVYTYPGDDLGTSEFSPVEIIQPGILLICGLLYAWVALNCPTQRPIAFLFGGMALVFMIRELDFFLDRYVADNFWQMLIAVVSALVIAYTYRHRRRFRIAWLRMWPSPGLTLLFAGATIMFAFSLLVGHEPLWQAILGENYHRIVKLAVEEFIELSAYFLWIIGTIEYTYQARAIAFRVPQPLASKRRKDRFPKSEGRF
jgi:hypothetical protein